MRGEPEVHKKGLFASGRLRSVGILLSDLGFTRDGEPGFRSSAPPPDGAGRAGAQRRVPDGAGRTRLRAAPGSLPAREVLLLAPLHGSTHRSVLTFFFFLSRALNTWRVAYSVWDARCGDFFACIYKGNCAAFALCCELFISARGSKYNLCTRQN